MTKYIRVCDLAGELNISIAEVVRVAKSLGINVNRGVANLHSGQAFKIREAVANRSLRRRDLRLAALSPPSPPEPEPPQVSNSTCVCCRYPFVYRPLDESGEICKDCSRHFQQEAEPSDRTMVRLEEHEAMSRAKFEQYREACRKLRLF